MKKKDRFTNIFGSLSLFVLIWVWISAMYYFAEMLGYSLVDVGLYLWGIGLVLTIVVGFMYRKKWLEVWYVLKPSILRIVVFLWHLFAYFVTRNILFNFLITIAFTFYTLRRCECIQLRGLDIRDELNRVLKWNNNALYMTSIFFLWYYIRMSHIVETMMQMLGMDYVMSMFALICFFMIAVFGLVRFQYVIGLQIAHVKLKQ